MPIVNTEKWKTWEEANKEEPYGKCCVDVARQVMVILDAEPGDFDHHKLVCRADDAIKAGGITGFMAGAVAQMVAECHSRGEEFRTKWNAPYKPPEDFKGTVNPAIIEIDLEH